MPDDTTGKTACDGRRIIGRTVVDDDDLIALADHGKQRRQYLRKGRSLVVGGQYYAGYCGGGRSGGHDQGCVYTPRAFEDALWCETTLIGLYQAAYSDVGGSPSDD